MVRTDAENCVFGCNVLQAITHDAGPVDCDDQFLELVNVMSRMKHKLGPMLFQFPCCNRKSPVRQREFIDRLRGFLPKLPAELRFTHRNREQGPGWSRNCWTCPGNTRSP
jgi:uncharacterized protein YecE (DUF72 family)